MHEFPNSEIEVKLIEGMSEDSPHVEGTTLLKYVPFDEIDKDERDEITESIEWLQHRACECDLRLGMLTAFNPGKEDVQVGPVFEVISVTISHQNNPSWDHFEIYGEISINGYKIYDKKSDDAQAVSPGHNFLAISCCPIAPVTMGKVIFSLTNVRTNARYVGEFPIYYSIRDQCDIEKDDFSVSGIDGYKVTMVYNMIPFAVIANFSVYLAGPHEANPAELICLDGDILANGIPILKNNHFKLAFQEPKRNVYSFERTRTAIAVPACGWLSVEFLMTRNGTKFHDDFVQSDPTAPTYISFTSCNEEGYYFCMHVEWMHPDEFFSQKDQPPATVTSDPALIGDVNVKCSSDFVPQIDHLPLAAVSSSYDHVEVFSIIICGRDSTPPALCGTIAVRDRDKTAYIFSRNAVHPDKVLSDEHHFGRTLSLAWPTDRWVLEERFYMHLKLKDVQGRSVCRGRLCWPETRFDRRTCAVIPGEDGYYAAVHYSIFKNGLRAKVTIECEGPDQECLDVYGSVVAEYSNHDYISTYDQECYRIIIFDRPSECPVKVKSCSEIPLSKSLVTAPSNCKALCVYASLKACPATTSHYLTSGSHKFRFKAGTDDTRSLWMYDHQSGVRVQFIVKVDWFC